MKFSLLVYNSVFIPASRLVIAALKPFNKKLKEREDLYKSVLEQASAGKSIEKKTCPRIWFHASSMGEFEQAKPIIERIKKHNPNICVVVSFFSPSGYNTQKDYEFADAVLYLPFDTRKNVKTFLNIIKPDAAVFIRYEIWPNYLQQLQKHSIPVFLISATRPGSSVLRNWPFFKRFARDNYDYFTKIYTVGKQHTKFFNNFGVSTEVRTSFDTRFDRIMEKVEKGSRKKLVPDGITKCNGLVLVAGSTWLPDEELIVKACNELVREKGLFIRLILVPHEPTETNLMRIKKLFPHSFYLSEIESYLEETPDSEKSEQALQAFIGNSHIIVDSIGKLLRLYANADLAYIGGAFGAGLHSVTEPAGYGIPLVSGPKINSAPDAPALLESNALSTIKNHTELMNWISLMYEDIELRVRYGQNAADYVRKGTGASKNIAANIIEILDN